MPNKFPQIGVGIQYNPALIGWFPFLEITVDAYEILLDHVMGSVDDPSPFQQEIMESLEPLRQRGTLIAHSNFGNELGFAPLEETLAVRRHVPIARMLDSPWVSDHCIYADLSNAETWACPLQWSHAEIKRLAPRVRTLQELYGMPLLHENPVYYFPVPGSEMSDAEFLARLVEEAGTYLHVDLHNVYTNSRNLPGYRWEDFLSTIPVDRVGEIHLAGGPYVGGFHHDWHEERVPEPVWEMLEELLSKTQVGAVIVEYEGRLVDGRELPESRKLNPETDTDIIIADVERAKAIWDKVYGPGSRNSTRVRQAG
jgi:hypothetical protein